MGVYHKLISRNLKKPGTNVGAKLLCVLAALATESFSSASLARQHINCISEKHANEQTEALAYPTEQLRLSQHDVPQHISSLFRAWEGGKRGSARWVRQK